MVMIFTLWMGIFPFSSILWTIGKNLGQSLELKILGCRLHVCVNCVTHVMVEMITRLINAKWDKLDIIIPCTWLDDENIFLIV